MKKFLLSGLSFILILSACNQQPQAAEETIVETVELEIYGDSTMTADGAINASELIAAMNGQDSIMVKVKGEIQECCQKKGCWMDVDMGNGKSMTVRFKDYGFFVPMNSAGRMAILDGMAKVDTQSVDWLRHKAMDAGSTDEEIAAITEPVVSVTFLANGVILE
jgi:hypothetical protein